MNHFRLYRDPEARKKGQTLYRVVEQPSLDLSWRVGQRFARPPRTPIRCIVAGGDGAVLPDAFLSDRIPLFSDRLVHSLRAAGVENLDCYEAQLIDASGVLLAARYHAVNIIGLVAAVDRSRSETSPRSGYPMTEFTHLVVDEQAARGCKVFRLADNPSIVLVDDAVRRALDVVDLIGVRALALNDRAAY